MVKRNTKINKAYYNEILEQCLDMSITGHCINDNIKEVVGWLTPLPCEKVKLCQFKSAALVAARLVRKRKG